MFLCILEKYDILILKVAIKNLHCCCCTKTQFSFILDYRGVEEEEAGVAEAGSLSKWNLGKIIKIS